MTKAIIDIAAPLGISVHDHNHRRQGRACEHEGDAVDLIATSKAKRRRKGASRKRVFRNQLSSSSAGRRGASKPSGALDPAAVIVPVVAAAAALTVAGNRCTGAGADHRADGSTAAATDRSADDRARRAAEQARRRGCSCAAASWAGSARVQGPTTPQSQTSESFPESSC